MSFSKETGLDIAAAMTAMPREKIRPIRRIAIAYATRHDHLHLLSARRERRRQQAAEDGGAEGPLRCSQASRREDVPAKRQRRFSQRRNRSGHPEAPHRRRNPQEERDGGE